MFTFAAVAQDTLTFNDLTPNVIDRWEEYQAQQPWWMNTLSERFPYIWAKVEGTYDWWKQTKEDLHRRLPERSACRKFDDMCQYTRCPE
jgi:hypothetical protein